MKVAVFNDTRSDRGHLGCALVMDRLDALIRDCGGEIVFRQPFDRDWRDAMDELPGPGEIDLVLVNGEGTMHGAPARSNATALAELGAFAKTHLETPTILLNATLHNNDSAFYESLKAFDLVWLRDMMSCDAAREYGIEARYCPDLTLSARSPSPQTARTGIGVTGSVVHRQDLALRKFARRIGAEFVSMVGTRSPPLSSFVAPRLGRIRSAWRERARYRDIGAGSIQHPQDFLKWVAEKSLIVTGRYHTATLCILTQTPFLYFESNIPKTSALSIDVGLQPQRKIETNDLDGKCNLYNLVRRSRFSDSETRAIAAFLSENEDRFEQVRASIRALVDPAPHRIS